MDPRRRSSLSFGGFPALAFLARWVAAATLATPVAALDFAEEPLVYLEDFEAETAFPLTPEIDLISAGSLVSPLVVSDQPVTLTGTSARFFADPTLVPNNATVGVASGGLAPLAFDSFAMRGRYSSFASTDDETGFLAVGAAFDIGAVVAAGVSAILTVEPNASGAPVAALLITQSDGFGGIPIVQSVLLSTAKATAIAAGASAELDLLIDRDLGTATASVAVDGFADTEIGPTALLRVDAPTFPLDFAGAIVYSASGGGEVEAELERLAFFRTVGSSFVVDETVDAVDANPGDGVCETAGGTCSLRAAVQEANADSDWSEILLPAGMYGLTLAGAGEELAASGDLDLRADVIVRGAGRDTTLVDANGLDRVFDVPLVPQTGGAIVHLHDLTLRGGSATGSGDEQGGGILNWGRLEVARGLVTDNESGGGGGIMNHGALVLNDTIVSDNRAVSVGSGLPYGGGVSSRADTSSILPVRTTIRRSAIVRNESNPRGAGVELSGLGSVHVIENTTISDNAKSGGSIFPVSQLFVNQIERVDLQFTTIAAGAAGGSAVQLNEINVPPLDIAFLSVALDGSPACDLPSSLFYDAFFPGPSASSDTTCLFGNDFGFSSGASLQLSPLVAANGSLARVPLLGSPLLDIDDAFVTSCPTVDQLGNARPVEADGDGSPECDIGAIEAPEPGFIGALLVSALGLLCGARRFGRGASGEDPGPNRSGRRFFFAWLAGP
ncbi:MAG: CSLREA domain-containing protein [Myxococcota bacterium]